MKNFINRIYVAAIMLVLGGIAAFAQNSLKIEDFNMAPEEVKTLEILLDNTDYISSLECLVEFPEGLDYVDESIAKVTSRITRSSHSVTVIKRGERLYNIYVLTTSSSMANSNIKGNSGAILTIDVKAARAYKGGNIEITDIIGSDGINQVNGMPQRIDMDNATVKADVHVGDITADEAGVKVLPNEAATVGFSLTNVIDIVGLQAVITLPEGVSLTEDEDGEYITYSDRLSGNVFANIAPLSEEDNTYILIISSLTSDVFDGTEGTLFGLNVVAEGACSGDITVSDIKVSSKYGVSYDLDNTVTVAFESAYDDPTADGVWDIDDIYAVIDAKITGNNPACDLNGDGVIDIDDIYFAIDKKIEQNK